MLKRSLIGTIILFFLTFLIPAGCARCSKLPPVWKTALGYTRYGGFEQFVHPVLSLKNCN